MQIVTFPAHLVDAYLLEARELLESGRVAEGRYFREQCEPFVKGRHSIPVSSGGAALLALLAFHRQTAGRNRAIVQSNTMRALYTVPRLLGIEPQVVDSSYDDFMAMSPVALERALAQPGVTSSAIVVYSVIGGYLAPSFAQVSKLCRHYGVPLVVDGAHAHYLEALTRDESVDLAYSFYATKVLPSGEGGLIVSPDPERVAWLRRFLMYDRFANELDVGVNLRASELTGALIHRLMTDASLAGHFKTARVEIAQGYAAICNERGIRYLDPSAATDYNGYKLVVLDSLERVTALGTPLTQHAPTSAVFDTDVLGRSTTLPHWCPPTYSSMAAARP